VHAEVNQLLDARNFFIALLTEDGTELDFPYQVDERDAPTSRRKVARRDLNGRAPPSSSTSTSSRTSRPIPLPLFCPRRVNTALT